MSELSTVAAIVAALGGLTGWAAWVRERAAARRVAAEIAMMARRADIESLCTALSQLRDENRRMCERIESLERDNADLRRRLAESSAEIERLQSQIEALQAENAALKAKPTRRVKAD